MSRKKMHHKSRMPTCAATALTLLASGWGAMALAAPARAATQSYKIPGGPVASALNRLADASGAQLVYDSNLTRNRTTRGVKGRRTLGGALDKVLAGTGLDYQLAPDGTAVTIQLAQAATGTQSDASPVRLPTIDVNASKQTGYSVPNAMGATKTDTPIFQTPVSIQVVPAEVIEDQKAFRVQDALENVSGVQPRGSLGGFRERYIIRGFRAGENFYRNGLRVASSGFTSNFQTADIDRIEVVKGGGSVLYGRGEPSGSILLWTKMPTKVPNYWVEQNFGSYGQYRTQWDLGAPLMDDGSLAYRFSGAYTNSQSFRDFGKSNSIVIYPSFLWRPAPSTEVTLGIEFVNQNFYADYGIPALGNLPAPIPISRSLQDPSDPIDNNRTFNLDYSLKHQINESWSLVNRFLASFRHSSNVDIAPLGHGDGIGSLNSDNMTLDRRPSIQFFDQTTYSTNLDLIGKFNTWGLEHKVLVGIDYFNDDVPYISGSQRGPNGLFPINIFTPVYGLEPSIYKNVPPLFVSDTKENWFGVYFQDQITIWDRLHIMAGGRQDWINMQDTNFLDHKSQTQTLQAFSPRVGALYELFPWLAVYGNWSQTFGANNGIDANGKQLPPETGEQYEVGLKGQSLDGRVQSTLAFYNITKQNVVTRDLNFPDELIFRPIGLVRSRGIELDIDGRIMEGLDAIVAFAYTDARILVDGFGNQGHRVQGVPTTSGRLWLKYEFPKDSFLSGFAIGGGPYLASNRAGDDENTFTLPGFARLDLMASYTTKVANYPMTAQLNVRNALNQRYFDFADTSNASPRVSITPGDPLTIIGSLRVQF